LADFSWIADLSKSALLPPYVWLTPKLTLLAVNALGLPLKIQDKKKEVKTFIARNVKPKPI
jgi:hypothetical protein